MESSIRLYIIVFASLHWVYLLYCYNDISYWRIYLCFVTILWKSIYHTQRIVGFIILYVWRVFPRYILSLVVDWFIWTIYEDDLCGWYIYEIYTWMIYIRGWYIYEIHMWLIYSYVVDLWDTYVLKLIEKSFEVQVFAILLKHQHGIKA